MHGQYQERTRAFLWTLVTLEVAAETSVSPGKPIGQEYGCSGQDPQETQASKVPSKTANVLFNSPVPITESEFVVKIPTMTNCKLRWLHR